MKILFWGDSRNNTGPSNVNKSLKENMTSEFLLVKSENKILKALELIIKLIFCRIVVVSGLTKNGLNISKAAKKLGKKIVYIMHGCSEYESLCNYMVMNQNGAEIERKMLKNADFILAVSENFMKWVKDYYPEHKDKVYFLNNGIEKKDYGAPDYEKVKGSVIAVGGDRKTKNNEPLCKAIENMNGDAFINVCGCINNMTNMPTDTKYIEYTDIIPQKQLYQLMAKSQIFVLNSTFEPFSLSVIDALNCKCSILLSSAVGINGILELTDDDIIYDPNDTEEIERKIRNLMEHPNYERISAALDYDKLSYEKAVEKLSVICHKVVKTH